MIHGRKIFNKVLVANRGEIAVRIIRTLKSMGISSVAVFSSFEKDALHVKIADEAYELTGETLTDTYLDIQKIVNIAVHSGCDAIHPGYGFLSENSTFAEAVMDSGINFIGPTPDVISLMGNKREARKTVSEINIPIASGFEGTVDEILARVSELEYPLLIKAVAGGGGKAMHIVHSPDELSGELESARREAVNYFGDDNLYIEKYLSYARHIEIQVIADHYGDILILGDRECSMQRRYQKVIEESPSVFLNPETREKLFKTTVDLVKHIGYVNAGTVEFLVDDSQNFYFLEMNTRLQVEHPVTEMITGIDIVELQVFVAAGNTIGLGQYDIRFNGHAIEARVYAEDTSNNFIPSPGRIWAYREPSLPGLRIDTSIKGPTNILPDFDPLIAKVVFHAPSREEAITGLRKALSEFVILGTNTNREFLIECLDNNHYLSNKISTTFLEENTSKIVADLKELKDSVPVNKILAAWLASEFFSIKKDFSGNIWEYIGEWKHVIHKSVNFREKQHDILITSIGSSSLTFRIDEEMHELNLKGSDPSGFIFELNDEWSYASVVSKKYPYDIAFLNGYEYELKTMNFLPSEPSLKEDDFSMSNGPKIVKSPLHGRIVRVQRKLSDMVEKGDVLFFLDAMKMENKIVSPVAGCVRELKVFEGEQVSAGQPLIIIDECGSEKKTK